MLFSLVKRINDNISISHYQINVILVEWKIRMKLLSIASGSSGNCIYIGSTSTHILIDAGISRKRIVEGLNTLSLTLDDIDAIFITHEHIDHIQSLGVLERTRVIPVYTSAGTAQGIMATKSLGKIPEGIFNIVSADELISIGDLVVKPFTISHDAAEPLAYRIEREDKAVAVATDMGTYDDYTVSSLKGLNAILLEANHDLNMLQVGSYPYYLKQRISGEYGHLSNEMSGSLLNRILNKNLKDILIGHLSRENNYEELAYETVCLAVNQGDTPYKAEDFNIKVAKRDRVTELVII